ncbi:MAG: hypothetical protein KJ583_01865 [Nanoarchaeota archaeon]|nr:hypothetical protein [Nanoarchaeota archaeon]MBU1269948.1 hypothetical protein [Nanoarchaeota archaeon]MBU1604039.1 hypothetical protein [Nanoarchaeota archaeon]MBU2442478.1 hypothetical protein [Nanoarchaeota archaeon]
MHKTDHNGALTDLMSREEIKIYTYDRKLHPDPSFRKIQLENMKLFKEHNAFRTEEVENLFLDANINYVKYKPLKSEEYHFYIPSTGDLHIVNTRGDMRLLRDLDQYLALKEIAKIQGLRKEERHYKNDKARASMRFIELAFNLVDELYPLIDKKAVEEQKQINIILGPLESLTTKNVYVEAENKNDFLNARIIRIGEKPVVNFDYVFADQGKNVLENIYIITKAKFPDANINIFHYGKVGILNPDIQVEAICLPTGALSERKVIEGTPRIHPIYNLLESDKMLMGLFEELIGEKAKSGTTTDSTAVLRQKRKNLELCLSAGGDFVDMEWRSMSTNPYMNYFFAGVGSDKPLKGKNLANTEYQKEKEINVAEAFKEIIRII